ncbi:hypothetical protein VTL71DRAFT_15297 [Oculimacula yallundae]|uniref:RBR-type E3 ubiquitin transferase n=1 Tax=Oculimacula yallundae TaxID=86028 RepID=A0ABR4CIH0_9HELO
MARKSTLQRPLPDLIFDRPPAEWNLPLLKQVLACFNKPLIARQFRKTMLIRLADLANDTPLLKQYAVAQILRRGALLTREAVDAWPKEEPEEAEPMDDEPDRYCDACNDTLTASKYRQTKLHSECNHDCSICELCLGQAISAQLSDGTTEWDELHCPTCSAILRPETVRKYASGGMLADFDEFRVSFHMRNLPNFCWCRSITCHSGQIHTAGVKNPKMTCVKCAFESCSIHHVAWDEGSQPAQHNASSCEHFLNDPDMDVIGRNTKACPHCGSFILKDGGCDHMYCSACHKPFSWNRIKHNSNGFGKNAIHQSTSN